MDIIEISKILFFASIIVWIIPPIRQYKTRLFIFFLILGIMDPLSLLYKYLTNFPFPLEGYLVFNYIMLLTILPGKTFYKYKPYLLAFTPIMILPMLYTIQKPITYLIVVFLFITMFFIILRNFIITSTKSRKLNFFYMVLLLYLLTIILKFTVLIFGFIDATANFIVTSIFQAVIGLYFSIFREDNPRFIFKLQ